MRARRISILVLIILLVVAGIAWLVVQQPKPQTISLPHDSQLTLLKVTYGTNHVCRYGSRLQDLFYPILPKKLRAKFSPRVMTFASGSGDTVMVWIRHDGGTTSGSWPPAFFLAVVDENGLESRLLQRPNLTRTLNPRGPGLATTTGAGNVAQVGGQPASRVTGWELEDYPRRAKQFWIRVYCQETDERVPCVGTFSIASVARHNIPAWQPEPLPAARRTNDMEITLVRLETGLTGDEVGIRSVGDGARAFSRATFTLKKNEIPQKEWRIYRISARNAAGGVRQAGVQSSRWQYADYLVDFNGALWPEEPVWKLEVDFARTGDFQPEELWMIQGVRAPQPGELIEMRAVTNLFHAELEFRGVSGAKAKVFEEYSATQPYANVHVRTPYLLDDLLVLLVEVRDDRGRSAKLQGLSRVASTGGRGNTPKEMLHSFGLDIPEGAETLDITLATTPVRHVEFLAKPALTESARRK